MTFAELILAVSLGVGLYFFLRPLRGRLEVYLLKKFHSRRRAGSDKPIIDVTDYTEYKAKRDKDKSTP